MKKINLKECLGNWTKEAVNKTLDMIVALAKSIGFGLFSKPARPVEINVAKLIREVNSENISPRLIDAKLAQTTLRKTL